MHGEAALLATLLTGTAVVLGQVPPTWLGGNGLTLIVHLGVGQQLLLDDSVGS